MNRTDLRPGDVVSRRLEDQGFMTVEEVRGGWVLCCWFNDNHQFHRDNFRRHELDLWRRVPRKRWRESE
jgi:uncharacterized protein YodC (DUF2158 family)